MNPDEHSQDDSLSKILVEVMKWIEVTSVRLSAHELLLKQKGVTEQELAAALTEARRVSPVGPEGLADLNEILRRASKI